MYQRLGDINEEGVAYPTSVGVLGWWFMDRETIIQTIAKTSLNGGISSGASSLILTSATGWTSPSNAVAGGYIKNAKSIFDFFTYETLTANTASVVANISQSHSSLEEVHKVYEVPTDFGYPRALYKQSVYLKYFRADHALRQVPAHPFYTIKYLVGTNFSNRFVVFPWNIGAMDWNLQYQKSAINLDAVATDDKSATKLDLPYGHGRRFYIEKMKAYIYEIIGNDSDSQIADAKAKDHIEKLLDEYGIEDMASDQSGIVLSDW